MPTLSTVPGTLAKRLAVGALAVAFGTACTTSGGGPDDTDSASTGSDLPTEAVDYQDQYEDAVAWEDPCDVFWMGTVSSDGAPPDVTVVSSDQLVDQGPTCSVQFEYGSGSHAAVTVYMVAFPNSAEALDEYTEARDQTASSTAESPDDVSEIGSPWNAGDTPGIYAQSAEVPFMAEAKVPGDYFYLGILVNYPGNSAGDDVCDDNVETSAFEPPCEIDPEPVRRYLEDEYLPALHDHLNEIQKD